MNPQPGLWRIFVPLLPWVVIVLVIALIIWIVRRFVGH
jgi:hypothetical protein